MGLFYKNNQNGQIQCLLFYYIHENKVSLNNYAQNGGTKLQSVLFEENHDQQISLNISSLAGIYIITSIGIVSSIILLTIEMRYQKLLIGGGCFQQEQNFNNPKNINHDMRFVEPSQSEDSTMNKLQQQIIGSNKRHHKMLSITYNPR